MSSAAPASATTPAAAAAAENAVKGGSAAKMAAVDNGSVVGSMKSVVSSKGAEQCIVSHRGYVPPIRQTGWINVIFIILADLVGTGVMSLPKDFADIGYIPGVLILAVFGALTFFSGILLWRMHMTYPSGITYGNLADAIGGVHLKRTLFCFVFGYFAFVLVIYIKNVAIALQNIFWMFDVCRYWFALAALGILIPLCQLRTLHSVSFAGMVSMLMIILVVCMLTFDAYATWDDRIKEEVVVAPVINPGFTTYLSTLIDLVFAYGGQGLYLEVMAEMKNPVDFKKSLYFISSSMVVFYLWSATSLYLRYGHFSQGSILYTIRGSAFKSVASVFFFVHVCISFCLIAQVVNRALHVRIAPKSVNKGDRTETIQWFCISVCTAVAAWLVCMIVPFITDIQNIISAVCTGPLTYFFPAFLYVLSCRKQGHAISKVWEWPILAFMMVIGVVFASAGTVTSFMTFADNLRTEHAHPFSCIMHST